MTTEIDLKTRLRKRRLGICDEALMRIEALEKTIAELENQATNLNDVLNDYADRESERQNDY